MDNTPTTISKFGERLAKAARFNKLYVEDMWFIDSESFRTYQKKLGSSEEGGEYYDPITARYESSKADKYLASLILDELESMDPTKNKQYVMTLVRWYIGSLKKDKQLQ